MSYSDIDTLNITIPVPCVQGQFGKRLVTYSTQISPLQIRKILGHDPRSSHWKLLPEPVQHIYEQIQRSTTKKRQESVAGYIDDRLSHDVVAAFPAVSIGIMSHTKFEPLGIPGMQRAVGTLDIDEASTRIMLDGLGRLAGALDLSEDSARGLALVRMCVFPVTFYCPAPDTGDLSIDELGQLFSDFNFRVNPVPRGFAIALDQSDIYIALTNKLARSFVIASHGGMQTRKGLGRKSTALVAQSVLLRTVRGACEGRDFQESNRAMPTDANLTPATFEREFASIQDHFVEIARRMDDKWEDRDSLHLSIPGWQALGVIHHDIYHRGMGLTEHERGAIYDAIADIDWSRQNPAWANEARLGHIRDGEVVLSGAGRSNVQAVIDYVRVKTGLRAMFGEIASDGGRKAA